MKRNSPPSRAPRSPHFAGIGTRKIFVIKRASRRQITNTKSAIIQRILIFDDHPASLRLVFGHRASPQTDLRASPSAGWWEPILAWMLIAGALIVVLTPFFLKLQS